MTTKAIREIRKRLDEACMRAAAEDPNGNMIEHCNHAILEVAHQLGAALRAGRPMSKRALRALGNI